MYEDTPERFAEMTILERDDILLFEHEADHFRTAYAIALVPDRKEVRCTYCVAWPSCTVQQAGMKRSFMSLCTSVCNSFQEPGS